MKKRFLFRKFIAMILIILMTLSVSLTFNISKAAGQSANYGYFNFTFPTTAESHQYRNVLKSFNLFTKNLSPNANVFTTQSQMFSKLRDLQGQYSSSPAVSNIINKLFVNILSNKSNNSNDLIQNVLKQIAQLFTSSYITFVPNKTETISATTAGKLSGDKYNVNLIGKIYYAQKDGNGNPTSKKWVVLVHGTQMNGQAITDVLGKMYIEQGYNILAPDLRGNGNSGGSTGMGYLESLDIYDWITYLNNQYPNNCDQIIVHGLSLGGATTVFLSGLDVDGVTLKDKKVIGLVEDCGYRSLTGIITDMLGSNSPLISQILGSSVDTSSGSVSPELIKKVLMEKIDVGLTNENFDEKQDGLKSLAKANLPLLIIHGTKDGTVPYSNSDVIYQTAMNNHNIPYVQRFTAQDEDHAFIVMGNKYNVYEGHVKNFIKEAESIAAGNTTNKESSYKEEKAETTSPWTKISKIFNLFKNMIFK